MVFVVSCFVAVVVMITFSSDMVSGSISGVSVSVGVVSWVVEVIVVAFTNRINSVIHFDLKNWLTLLVQFLYFKLYVVPERILQIAEYLGFKFVRPGLGLVLK